MHGAAAGSQFRWMARCFVRTCVCCYRRQPAVAARLHGSLGLINNAQLPCHHHAVDMT